MWISREEYINAVTIVARYHALLARVEYMTQENAALREAISQEKSRADSAVDRLLEERGISPVTPARTPSLEALSQMFEEEPEEVAIIKERIGKDGAVSVLLETAERGV